MLAREMGVRFGKQDTLLAGGVVDDGGSDFALAVASNDQAPNGVGAEIETKNAFHRP